MRSFSVELCGESLELPVTWEVGEALAKAGFDPLEIVVTAVDGAAVRTSAAVITILHAGAKAAGSKLTRAQIGEAAYGNLLPHLTMASDYVAAFLHPPAEAE